MNNKAFIANLEHLRIAVLGAKMILRLKEARVSNLFLLKFIKGIVRISSREQKYFS
jgi:hypothetical protein